MSPWSRIGLAMAEPQAQSAALCASLVDSMGEEAADTLMDQLPPTGWDQMATKEDLAGVELRLQAAFATAIAQINASITETNARITETNADLRVEMHKASLRLPRSGPRSSRARPSSSTSSSPPSPRPPSRSGLRYSRERPARS